MDILLAWDAALQKNAAALAPPTRVQRLLPSPELKGLQTITCSLKKKLSSSAREAEERGSVENTQTAFRLTRHALSSVFWRCDFAHPADMVAGACVSAEPVINVYYQVLNRETGKVFEEVIPGPVWSILKGL